MAWFSLILLAVITYVLVQRSKNQRQTFKPVQLRSKQSLPPLSKKSSLQPDVPVNDWKTTYFKPPITKGYQLYLTGLGVAGIEYRLENALAFYRSKSEELRLEPEPDNSHDNNAIKILGVHNDDTFFLGYVPRDTALLLAKTQLLTCVYPRLAKISVNRDTAIQISFSIVGPKTDKKKIDDYLFNQPSTKEQKEHLAFFNIPIPAGLKSGQAEELIQSHKKTATEAELQEWDSYNNIFEYFEDKDSLKDFHNLKKVSNKLLLEALTQLKNEGHSYAELDDDIDEVVDRILEIKPELEYR